MKVEIKNDIKDRQYIDSFMNEVRDISGRIIRLVENKDVSIRLVNSIYDIKPDKLDYYSISRVGVHDIQGVISEDENCIAICKNNTDIKDIRKVLFHELGHFLDVYEKFGNIKSTYDLTYSTSSQFINAYREDLMKSWDKLQNNTVVPDFCLINSTPQRANQTAVIETFAEVFRYLYTGENTYIGTFFENCIQAYKCFELPFPEL